jgi:hypothetical protein
MATLDELIQHLDDRFDPDRDAAGMSWADEELLHCVKILNQRLSAIESAAGFLKQDEPAPVDQQPETGDLRQAVEQLLDDVRRWTEDATMESVSTASKADRNYLKGEAYMSWQVEQHLVGILNSKPAPAAPKKRGEWQDVFTGDFKVGDRYRSTHTIPWMYLDDATDPRSIENYLATVGSDPQVQRRVERKTNKWHDLTENPRDLPDSIRDVLVILDDDQKPFCGYRNDGRWMLYMPSGAKPQSGVIAWRELPKFKPERSA